MSPFLWNLEVNFIADNDCLQVATTSFIRNEEIFRHPLSKEDAGVCIYSFPWTWTRMQCSTAVLFNTPSKCETQYTSRLLDDAATCAYLPDGSQ